MVEVTQEDREVLIKLMGYDSETIDAILAGSAFTWEVEQIARHRIAARNAALEEAAKAVERELALTAVANSEASSEWIDGFEFAWERVKAAIRNLKGPSDVD